MNETDDLSLASYLEEAHGFSIVSVKRTPLGREIFTLDRAVTSALVEAYQASAWKQARDQYRPPGHQG